MNIKTVAIGCDHAGYPYKKAIVDFLKMHEFEVIDFGTNSIESVDYPDFAHPVAEAVTSGKAQAGVVMCGSGNGVAITVNKHKGIRCALCWKPELAVLARQHNDANVISLPVRYIEENDAVEMVRLFLQTAFEGGRHANRVGKIDC